MGRALSGKDFHIFSKSFARILLERIPTATDVCFLTAVGQLDTLLADGRRRKRCKLLYEEVITLGKALKSLDEGFFFPFLLEDEGMAVARVSGIDALVVERAAEDWLAEIQAAVFKDFLYLKQARIDPETGLFNSANLFSLLDALHDFEMVQLVLIELPPRLRFPRDPFQNALKAAQALQEYAGGGLVHHLGQCVFAILLLRQNTQENTVRFGSSLVSSLKRAGFDRVHVGSSLGEGRAKNDDEKKQKQNRLLAEAWTALQTAGRRGPFSFCDYRVLAHPERHPLKPHNPALGRKIRERCKLVESFCLIEVKFESQTELSFSQIIDGYAFPERIVVGDDRLVVFLEDSDEEAARAWFHTFHKALTEEKGGQFQMSAGIACYPHADFKKSEILSNSRKALLHSAFFGPGSITAFDAVSLNVSGDIYYSDGDLPSAVREYRRGLVCEPGNVNLLNSLGVSYAMMNKHSLARESFKKALAIDPENCMSLYNLGLEEVLRGNISRGLQCFEKALGAHLDDDGPEVKRDLQFQLAKLYCGLQVFDKALELLTQWYEACESSQSGGHALRYLGEACFGLGNKSEAMVWLQKALRFNEIDYEALSLLGLVYLEEGEGRDIALALCQKSVELNPADRRTRLRLAKVQISCGLFADARKNLVKCRGNKHIQMERQFLMGRICLKMGRRRQANAWFAKVLQQENIPPEMLHEIHAAIEN